MSIVEPVVESWEEIVEATETSASPIVQCKASPPSEVVNASKDATPSGVERSPLDDMQSLLKPALPTLLTNQDSEYDGCNYNATPPATTLPPTVKILRRPSRSSLDLDNGTNGKPKQVFKSLQQREQEYAEARLRILGSATNPLDDAAEVSTADTTIATAKVTSTSTTPVTSAGSGNKTTPPHLNGVKTPSQNSARQKKYTASYALQNTSFNGPPNQMYKNNANNFQPNITMSQLPQHLTTYYQKYPQHAPPSFNAKSGIYNQPPPTQLQQQQQQQPQQTFIAPSYNNFYANQQAHVSPPLSHSNQQQQLWSPAVGGCVSSPNIRQQFNYYHPTPPQLQMYQQPQPQQQQPQQPQQNPNNYASRLPRGPAAQSASTGFQYRR